MLLSALSATSPSVASPMFAVVVSTLPTGKIPPTSAVARSTATVVEPEPTNSVAVMFAPSIAVISPALSMTILPVEDWNLAMLTSASAACTWNIVPALGLPVCLTRNITFPAPVVTCCGEPPPWPPSNRTATSRSPAV